MTTEMTRPRVLKAGDVRVTPVIHLAGDSDALAQAEQDRRRELDDAYRAGVADGRRQAEDEGRTAAVRIMSELSRLSDTVASAAAHQVAADAASIAGVALEISRWILTREVTSDTTTVLRRIESALTELTPDAAIEIHVAPRHVADVEAWAAGGAEVRADPALTLGEARIVAGAATADLTYAEAFRRAAAALGLDNEGPCPTSGEEPAR